MSSSAAGDPVRAGAAGGKSILFALHQTRWQEDPGPSSNVAPHSLANFALVFFRPLQLACA